MAMDRVEISGTHCNREATVLFERAPRKRWKATVIVSGKKREFDLDNSNKPCMTVATDLVKQTLGVDRASRMQRAMGDFRKPLQLHSPED